MDLKGEEQFGRITSWLYSTLASGYNNELYGMAVCDILRSRARQILDVGTGPAGLPIALAKAGVNGRQISLYAIDPSKDMLNIARRRAKGLGIRFAQGYSLHVPFNKKFDIIVSSLSFHHWAHKGESLKYLSRFLAPRGEIRIYEYKKHSHGILGLLAGSHSMSPEEMRNAAKGTGLGTKRIIEHNGILCAVYVKEG